MACNVALLGLYFLWLWFTVWLIVKAGYPKDDRMKRVCRSLAAIGTCAVIILTVAWGIYRLPGVKNFADNVQQSAPGSAQAVAPTAESQQPLTGAPTSSEGASEGAPQTQSATESPLDVADAMTVFYGNYDAQAQHSLMTTAESTPDSSFPKGTRLAVQPIFSTLAREARPITFTLVTAAVPLDRPFDCHVCSPVIGEAVFTWSGSRWEIDASNQQVTNLGAFGEPPSDIQAVQIGPNRSAVEIRQVDGGQGAHSTALALLVPWHGTVDLALQQIIEHDDGGICAPSGGLPCYSNHRTITFEPGRNPDYYDIELKLEGGDLSNGPPYHLIQVDGLERLAFENGVYRQVSRGGDLTALNKLAVGKEGSGVASPTPASDQSVKDAVNRWVDAFRSRDASALADCYAPVVEKYFRRDNVDYHQIQAWIQNSFAGIVDVRQYEIADIQVTVSPAAETIPVNSPVHSRATATFDKKWDVAQSDGKTFSGEEIEQLTFASSPTGWKIVREEELKILSASKR